MNLFDTAALLVTLAAVFSYLNHRFVRLPTTIGLMAIALAMSLGLIVLGALGATFPHSLARVIASVDFDRTLIKASDELLADQFVSDETWEALAERYSTEQLMEVVALVGTYLTMAMVTRNFQIPLEDAETFNGFAQQRHYT